MVGTRQHPEDFPPPALSSSAASKNSDTQRQTATRRQLSQWAHSPSPIVQLWLIISLPLVLWDTGYVLLRPHSMPGGVYHHFWSPYALYGTIDYIYGWPAFNSRNGFTSAQATLNIVETTLYIYYLFLVWTQAKPVSIARNSGKSSKGASEWSVLQKKSVTGTAGAYALLAIFSASLMTLSKTVLYGLNEAYSGFDNIGHNDMFTLAFLWILPNGLWIIFPAFATFLHGREIVGSLETASVEANPKPKSS
ncbi:hypothetical protein TESG_05384 [Trichophyton tonsurans CBS 112818]|uniref:C6 transcription factor n=2 Tax=Trichophyton TaxID=5550 RepID=F2PKH9_TRIEC|nr:hypothetical protein TESG_05384 [Trichophyton tonsurans CBS 112818]EGE02397.1 hypothetical protein TEQG_01434 [Trichophyton equinum CBS 127.97]